MADKFALIVGSLIIGAGFASSGYLTEVGKEALKQQKLAVCWNPGITSQLNSLATQEAIVEFKTTYPSGMTEKDQDTTSGSFAATISGYAFTGASADWGTINCEGNIAYTYTRPDGTGVSKNDGSLVSYTVHPAADGWDSEMSEADIPSGTVEYDDDGPSASNP